MIKTEHSIEVKIVGPAVDFLQNSSQFEAEVRKILIIEVDLGTSEFFSGAEIGRYCVDNALISYNPKSPLRNVGEIIITSQVPYANLSEAQTIEDTLIEFINSTIRDFHNQLTEFISNNVQTA